jgi:hypothetical protein
VQAGVLVDADGAGLDREVEHMAAPRPGLVDEVQVVAGDREALRVVG